MEPSLEENELRVPTHDAGNRLAADPARRRWLRHVTSAVRGRRHRHVEYAVAKQGITPHGDPTQYRPAASEEFRHPGEGHEVSAGDRRAWMDRVVPAGRIRRQQHDTVSTTRDVP